MVEQKPEEANKRDEQPDAGNPPVPAVGPNQAPNASGIQRGQANQGGNFAQQIKHTDHIIARSAIVTAVLTFVLAILAALQAYSFIESERAYLVVDNVAFKHIEPSLAPDGLDLVIAVKNVGKHLALVTKFAVKPLFGTQHKELPETPNYEGGILGKVVPPIVPTGQITVNAHSMGIRPLPGQRDEDVSATNIIIGVINGDIPLWIIGFLDYDLGYPWFHQGAVGYCQQYIPEKSRVGDNRFETCNSPKYTYIR